MTARVCPVHGEYAADGVCRWCEPAPAPAKYSRAACDDVPMYMGVPVVVPDWSVNSLSDEPPMLVNWGPKESAVEKAFREQLATRAGMRPLFSTRQRYETPEGIASHNAFWEAKLAEEHAALRWERVARRWAGKHGPWNMRDVAFHWQTFINKLVDRHMEILTRNNPLLFDRPQEPKP